MATIQPKTKVIGATIEFTIDELIALNNTIDNMPSRSPTEVDGQEYLELRTVTEINRKIGEFLGSNVWVRE